MQFWSGTPFRKTAEIIAVARMFDDAGYDGLICSDHLMYPRELSSPYPDSPTGRPGWHPNRVAGFLGAHRRNGGGDEAAAFLQRGLYRARAPVDRGGQAGRDGVGAVRG